MSTADKYEGFESPKPEDGNCNDVETTFCAKFFRKLKSKCMFCLSSLDSDANHQSALKAIF
jgi:hypothetical protein